MVKYDPQLVILALKKQFGFLYKFIPNFLINSSEKKIYINDTMNFKDLQGILLENGYVNDLLSFSFLAKIMKYNESIKPGAYVIESNMSNYDLVEKLRSGKQTPVKITFNNVRNYRYIIYF